MKKPLKTALKLLVTLTLVCLLYRKVDARAFGEALTGIRWGVVPAFFAILLFNSWISAFRWGLLLRADGKPIPTAKLFVSYWIASFFNFFLPSNIGGDVYRIADVGQKSGTAMGSLASVFVDRLVGFLAMSFFGFVFPLLGLRIVPPEARATLFIPIVVFLGFLCLAALVWQQTLIRWFVRFLPGRLRTRVEGFLDSFFASISAYARHPKALWAAFGVSLVFQILVFTAVWVVGTALRLPIPFTHYCVFVPFVCLLESVPLSINGIGLRDSGYVLFFKSVGLGTMICAATGQPYDPATSAATLSLCYMGFTLLYACGGGLLFLRRLYSRKPSEPTP